VAVPDDGPPGYNAVIRTADGKEVWRANDLAPASSSAPLTLNVPAHLLMAADYRLSVAGDVMREDDAPSAAPLEFSLRIIRAR
jgi:hypothetical protein